MLRTALKISSLVMAFAVGFYAKSARTETVFVPGPTQIVMPWPSSGGVEYKPGIKQVNEDAEVPILVVNDYAMLRAVLNYDGPGFIEGAYYNPEPDDERIYILGEWSRSAETALHEYTHYLEHQMPDQAWRVRKAFHRICSDRFRIDSMDLIPELPEPTPK